jgi:hypothetical protein
VAQSLARHPARLYLLLHGHRHVLILVVSYTDTCNRCNFCIGSIAAQAARRAAHFYDRLIISIFNVTLYFWEFRLYSVDYPLLV